jgi:hypothetical protein
MILYHGSYAAIEKPDLSLSRVRTDFGKGFYLTPLKEQAVGWVQHYVRNGNPGIVSSYEFLEKATDKMPEWANVLEFNTHSRKWLDFITACRLGQPLDADYDLVIGGVANDKVFNTLELYSNGERTAAEAIRRLRYNKPNFQYCFKNQKLIDEHLRFIGAEVIE